MSNISSTGHMTQLSLVNVVCLFVCLFVCIFPGIPEAKYASLWFSYSQGNFGLCHVLKCFYFQKLEML